MKDKDLQEPSPDPPSNGVNQQENGDSVHHDEAPPADQTEKEDDERKITQTDHLNKRLLSSFLDRINQNPPVIPTECPASENDIDEFDDGVSTDLSSNTEKWYFAIGFQG